jgi:hypothetical protein
MIIDFTIYADIHACEKALVALTEVHEAMNPSYVALASDVNTTFIKPLPEVTL